MKYRNLEVKVKTVVFDVSGVEIVCGVNESGSLFWISPTWYGTDDPPFDTNDALNACNLALLDYRK